MRRKKTTSPPKTVYIVIDNDGNYVFTATELQQAIGDGFIYPTSKIMRVEFKPNVRLIPSRLEKF